MFDDCIIMAGGLGTRLWPASSSRLPKQFLPGPGGRSFFQAAVERGLAVSGRLIIITGKGHIRHVLDACDPLSVSEKARVVLIGEPLARNTAPAIACGVVFAERTAGYGRTMLVLTSDHVIGPLEAFRADAEKAAALVEGTSPGAVPSLVVFGIAPSRPETGYGYIEAADGDSSARNCFRALSFREKPDRETAERFLAAGNFYWNSGMFAFNSDFMLEEFRKNEPELLAPFERLFVPGEGAYTVHRGIGVLENWSGLEAAYEAAKALCGVEDLIVVIRSGKDGGPASALIAKKGETQRLKAVVEQIKDAGRGELL